MDNGILKEKERVLAVLEAMNPEDERYKELQKIYLSYVDSEIKVDESDCKIGAEDRKVELAEQEAKKGLRWKLIPILVTGAVGLVQIWIMGSLEHGGIILPGKLDSRTMKVR